eukprot:1772051-Amphidinium_carterae.1
MAGSGLVWAAASHASWPPCQEGSLATPASKRRRQCGNPIQENSGGRCACKCATLCVGYYPKSTLHAAERSQSITMQHLLHCLASVWEVGIQLCTATYHQLACI